MKCQGSLPPQPPGSVPGGFPEGPEHPKRRGSGFRAQGFRVLKFKGLTFFGSGDTLN